MRFSVIRKECLALLALTLLLPACQTDGTSPQAVAETKIVAPVKNVVVFNAAALDESDRHEAAKALARATTAPLGQKVTWSNPQSGHSGVIIPLHDAYDASGAYCREFQQTLVFSGEQKQTRAKACQQQDGSWKNVS